MRILIIESSTVFYDRIANELPQLWKACSLPMNRITSAMLNEIRALGDIIVVNCDSKTLDQTIVRILDYPDVITHQMIFLDSDVRSSLRVFELGCSVILDPNCSPLLFIGAVNILAWGGSLFDKRLISSLKEMARQTITNSNCDLTDMEKTVLKHLRLGLSSREIGQIIHRSPRTVEDLRQKLYYKFGVKNIEQLIFRTANFSF